MLSILIEIKKCYSAFLKIDKNLNKYIFTYILFSALTRSMIAFSALSLTFFINRKFEINILGSFFVGIIFFYCTSRVLEFLFSIIQIRYYSNKILPISLKLIDYIIENSLKNYHFLKIDKNPLELSVLLNKKSDSRNFLGYLFNHILNPFIELLICSFLIIKVGFGLLGFLLIPACIIYFFIIIIILPYVKKQMLKIINVSAEQNQIFSNALNKCEIAHTFNSTEILNNYLHEITNKETKEYKKQLLINDFMSLILNFPLIIFSCFFFYFGTEMVLSGKASYGAFAAFIGLIMNSFSQFKNLTFAFDGLNQSLSALSFPIKIFEKSISINRKELNSIKNVNHIKFEKFKPLYLSSNVSVDFEIFENEKIFIVGESGIGKSSIFKSLLGYSKYDGNIYINDVLLDFNSRLNLFSWMPQDNHNIEGSIKFNLLLGNKNSTEEEMQNILKLLKIDNKINIIGGLNAEVEYQGKNFSGGEKQRLNLARSLLSDHPILLLDEPFSAIEENLEKEIYDIINNMKKTVIIISHNVKNIPDNSKILYITKNNGFYFDTKYELNKKNILL